MVSGKGISLVRYFVVREILTLEQNSREVDLRTLGKKRDFTVGKVFSAGVLTTQKSQESEHKLSPLKSNEHFFIFISRVQS